MYGQLNGYIKAWRNILSSVWRALANAAKEVMLCGVQDQFRTVPPDVIVEYGSTGYPLRYQAI